MGSGMPPKRKATFSSKSPTIALRSSRPLRILSGVPQLAAFNEAFDRSFESGRTCDFSLFLIGVVALDRLEVIARNS